MMTLAQRIDALAALGRHLAANDDEYLHALIQRTLYNNAWFTPDNQQRAIDAIATHFLDKQLLERWLAPYDLPETTEAPPKKVGLVLAGNIPLVGFHDILCVFAAGHKAQIKLSDKDPYVLPYLLKLLARFDERAAGYFEIVERLSGFDAVIATGSNNSARYFEAYFGAYPHIIRHNRNAVAVLTGNESQAELLALGDDVTRFFGLGCRSVAKLYVPRNYQFEPLLEALHEYRQVILHDKYKHNFDYNIAIFILNRVPHMANGSVILTESESLQSHIAGLYYEYYDSPQNLLQTLDARRDEIQCIVGNFPELDLPLVPFGQAQQPALWDYADGVDTMVFLKGVYTWIY